VAGLAGVRDIRVSVTRVRNRWTLSRIARLFAGGAAPRRRPSY